MTNPNIIVVIRKMFSCKNLCYLHNIRPQTHYSVSNKKILLLGLVPVVPNVPEVIKKETVEQKKESLQISTENEEAGDDVQSGWERLCTMFSEDEFGNYSKELTATFQSTSFACVFGLIYGGYKSSKVAYQDFMERNQATIFENHIDAKRRLQNHVTIHFGKGALHWACKLSAFTGGFMLLMTSLAAYRGHNSVLDYVLSGTLIGALARFQLGPQAMISGGTVGCVLGTFCGLLTVTMLSFTGTSLDEMLSFQHEIEHSRLSNQKKLYEFGFLKHTLEPKEQDMLKDHEATSKKGI